jgi:hypothetical protein
MKTKIELPPGIRFANAESEAHYRQALAGELNEYGFKPLIVITADGPARGKTRLARHILESRFGSCVVCEMPPGQAWDGLVNAALERGYLFMDDVCGRVDSPELARMLTAVMEMIAASGLAQLLDLQVIITGNRLQLSADLARRAICIELA